MAQSQFFRSFIRFLGSLTFLISLLALMLLALILPTVANQFNPDLGYDRTIGALRRDWYGAWWFNILMALLMVNLTVCTVIRTPWRFFWQWGFLITHSGILTLMIGAAVTFNAKIYGDLQAVEGGSYDYFTIEHENELVARTSDGQSGAFPIRSNPYHRSTDRKTFGIAKSPVKLTVEEFLPNVSPEPAYREDPQGKVSAAEVMFHFAEEEPKRMFLVPGRQETVGVLAISSMPMTEEEYADFIEPTGDKGRMTLTIAGETGVVDFATDKDKAVRVGGADVTLREWGAPKRENPNFWARFDLSRNGSAESWTINAFDHDHPLHRADGSHNDPGFTAHYAPRFTPEEIHGRGVRGAMYFCNLPGGVRWFALSSTGEKQHGPVSKGDRVRYPFMPIPLEFEFV
jgi:energy-coupling factor transporter transmembrane protein EcfT